jgi:hypothetical protein
MLFLFALAGLTVTYAGAFYAGYLYGTTRTTSTTGNRAGAPPDYEDVIAESKRELSRGR